MQGSTCIRGENQRRGCAESFTLLDVIASPIQGDDPMQGKKAIWLIALAALAALLMTALLATAFM